MHNGAMINLAIAHSYRSEFEKSRVILERVVTTKNNLPTQAALLSAYLHLHSVGGAKKVIGVCVIVWSFYWI